MSEVRPSVQEFASLMEERLRDNDHKGGWEDCDVSWLLMRLIGEVGELAEQLVKGEDPEQECADVANFAMMIAEVSHD